MKDVRRATVPKFGVHHGSNVVRGEDRLSACSRTHPLECLALSPGTPILAPVVVMQIVVMQIVVMQKWAGLVPEGVLHYPSKNHWRWRFVHG